jgi:tetratricopeptide (TPR) repeat protein
MINDNDGAIIDFSETINLRPNHAGAYNNRGVLYARKHEYDKAISDWQEALKLNPAKPGEVWQNLALAYACKKDKQQCLDALENALEHNPALKVIIRKNEAYNWLHDDPDFKKLIDK